MPPKRAHDTTVTRGGVSGASAAKKQQRVSSRTTAHSPTSSNSNSNSDHLRVGGSTADDDLAHLQQETLRISNEMLRSENEQLQVEVEILKESNKKLEKKLASTQQRVQVLEGDLTRWYKTQKRDAELKQAEHAVEIQKLQKLLDALAERSDISLGTTSSAATSAEMEPSSTSVPVTAAPPASCEQSVDDYLPPATDATESAATIADKPTAGMRYKKRDSVPSSLRLDGSKHHVMTSHFADKTCDFCCKLCIASDLGSHGRIGNKTRFCCLACDANLCKVKRWELRSKSCFDLWHSQAEFVKLRCHESSRWSSVGEAGQKEENPSLSAEGETQVSDDDAWSGQQRGRRVVLLAPRGNKREDEEEQSTRRTRSQIG